MTLEAGTLMGRVVLITGSGKAAGKTTLLNLCLGLLREAGERPAFFAIGFEGEGRDALTGGARPGIEARPGEVYLSSEAYLRASSCLPEILDVLPGSTALGRPVLVRAQRPGSAILVGPERNDLAALVVEKIRREAWARTVLADGALNRITQLSSLPGVACLHSSMVGPGDLQVQVGRIKQLNEFLALPAPGPDALALEGPLTKAVAEALPQDLGEVSVEDFTRVFLDPPEFASLRRRLTISVRRTIPFLGQVVTLRGLGREAFLQALDRAGAPESLGQGLIFNPYDLCRGAA